jgi:integrase
MSKRTYGEGGIDQRGENSFRLRYRIGKERFTETFSGTRAEAQKRLRALLRSGDTGEHVAPNKGTLAEWAKDWIEAGAPGRRRERNGQRAIERYDQLLRTHVLPTLGDTKLQGLSSTDIDKLYLGLEGKISTRTARHVHSVFNACLSAAKRTRKITVNPMESVTKVPSAGDSDHGIALDDDQLKTLLQGFKTSVLYPLVSVAAFTGARRNEILALRKDRNLSKEFGRRAKKILGFKFKLHWLRGTHETLLLDRSVPVHVVAARCGHDPAVLLRSYAKRTKKADTSAANVIGGLSKAILGA